MLPDEELYEEAVKHLSKIPDFSLSTLTLRIGNVKAECIPCLYCYKHLFVQDCYERGQRFEHKTTTDKNQALYWLFSDLLFEIALAYELKNRNPLEDNRRILFKKTEELFTLLGEPFLTMYKEEHENILQSHPYDDSIHKLLFLVTEYETMVKRINTLTNLLSKKGQKAVLAIQNRKYRLPNGGMKDPTKSLIKMQGEINTIQHELVNLPFSHEREYFIQHAATLDRIYRDLDLNCK